VAALELVGAAVLRDHRDRLLQLPGQRRLMHAGVGPPLLLGLGLARGQRCQDRRRGVQLRLGLAVAPHPSLRPQRQ
jgi:hypothetical protein